MATRPSGASRWACEARITVEATSCPQTDEDLARASLKPLLQLDGIVASVEDEKGNTIPTGDRPSNPLICSVATAFASWSGWTRSTHTGAVQLSRTKLSCATNW